MRDSPISYVLALVLLTTAFPALAGELYTTGSIGISGAVAESGGSTRFFQNTGSDSDSSPVYGGTIGMAIPVADFVPIPWEDSLRRWRVNLPTWDVRFEFEGLAGRDYELRTDGGDGYFAEVQNWAILNNVWMDLPIRDPITWAFGRVPLLEPVTIYGGIGLGFAATDVKATDNVSRGSETNYEFAWQAGAGIAYEVTEYVTLSAGYRYFDLGEAELTLYGAGPDPFGNYTLDVQAHEFTMAVRVNFYTVPWPTRE